MKKIVVLSDSHGSLDRKFYKHFKDSDEIWHAGDIGDYSEIIKLKEFGTCRFVYGNIDNNKIRKEFEEVLFFSCENLNIMMTHIGGYPKKYNKSVICLIKERKPDILICGHSHILRVEYDKKNKLLYLNPGACGDFGIHKVKTLLKFNLKNKKITDLKIVEIARNTI